MHPIRLQKKQFEMLKREFVAFILKQSIQNIANANKLLTMYCVANPFTSQIEQRENNNKKQIDTQNKTKQAINKHSNNSKILACESCLHVRTRFFSLDIYACIYLRVILIDTVQCCASFVPSNVALYD